MSGNAPDGSMSADCEKALEGYKAQFKNAMDDDINTADAISAIFDLVKYANVEFDESSSKAELDAAAALIRELGGVLGIIADKKADILDADIEALIEERNEARKAKNFARADEIRDMLKNSGIELEDTRQGVKWKRV